MEALAYFEVFRRLLPERFVPETRHCRSQAAAYTSLTTSDKMRIDERAAQLYREWRAGATRFEALAGPLE